MFGVNILGATLLLNKRSTLSVTKLFALTRGLITKNKKLKHNWGSSAGVICSLASVSSVASE